MRKLWIVVGALLVLFIATVVAATLSLNRLVAANHDRIIAEAQTALGRQVAVGRIGVSLWGGLGVQLDDIRIAEDPRFGGDDFVRVAALSIRAKLWPLLRQHFAIRQIVATQPQINLIRNAGGEWNYASLRRLAARQRSAVETGIIRVANEPAVGSPEPATRPVSSLVQGINVADGTVVVVDQTETPVRTIRVAQLDAAIHYSAPTASIAVSVAAAVAATARNLDVHGSIGLLNDAASLPLQLDGTLGPVGAFNGRIDALHVAATLQRTQVHVQELAGRVGGGTFTLSGDYSWQAGGTVSLKGTVRDLDLAAAVSTATADGTSRVGGKAHLVVDLSGTGTSPDAIAASLAGKVVADIEQGVITRWNIAKEVLGKASRLPVVGSIVSEKIKPKYARLFADPDTHFETLHGSFAIGGQRAQTDDLTIVAPDYGVVGHGWIGFNRRVDMAGNLRMSKRFSTDVVADVHAAKYLLDDQAQLALPFHLRGELGKARPKLDDDDIMALVQRGAGHGGAKDLLDQFLGAPPQGTPGKRKDSIEKGLRRLFGR